MNVKLFIISGQCDKVYTFSPAEHNKPISVFLEQHSEKLKAIRETKSYPLPTYWSAARSGSHLHADQRKTARVNIVTPNLMSVLDRTKLSDRKATFVLAAAAQSLGHDVRDLNINRSSTSTLICGHTI